MITKLEQISDQLNALNRLVRLLMMAESPLLVKLFGWYPIRDNGQWLSPAAQAAWSDELVKVARELRPHFNSINVAFWAELARSLNIKPVKGTFIDEAILNKYGRSLNEQPNYQDTKGE